MKKIVSLMFTALVAAQCVTAQIPAGIKFLNYQKNKSAKDAFQKAYDANPKDAQAIYWLGQAILATDGEDPSKEQIAAAKALYQKGLSDAGSDPWLLVGMGHVGILEKDDMNSVKQKFEQAITASTETKGKNKGKPSADILNAIGRANAEVASTSGDHPYAVDKLKQAATLDPANPDIMINLGINYLKMGGENGGEAVKAYQDALARDPKNARAFYRIGRIYLSQNNKDLFEQNFDNAITADPAFPPVYYAYYTYYSTRDVNKAKEYLDKYIASADKDPTLDLVLADYLFRSGKYSESLAKVKELDASTGSKALPKLNLLYALNYDRSGDSVNAKASLEKYFSNTPVDQIEPSDYDLAVKVFSKFPGSEAQTVSYLDKALANDTSRVNKANYMRQASDLYGKAKMYPQQVQWIQKRIALQGNNLTEADYYALSSAEVNAKDFTQALPLTKAYILAYPDRPQPYIFFKRAAVFSDPDSTNGSLVMNLNFVDSIYTLTNKDKYKDQIVSNQYTIILALVKKLGQLKDNPELKVRPDGTKPEVVEQFLAIVQQVIVICDSILAAFPDPTHQNNRFASDTKAGMLKYVDYFSKPPQPVRKTAAGGSKGK